MKWFAVYHAQGGGWGDIDNENYKYLKYRRFWSFERLRISETSKNEVLSICMRFFRAPIPREENSKIEFLPCFIEIKDIFKF